MSCSTSLDVDASFCGTCGDRIRPRSSLVGDVVDGLYVVETRVAEGRTASVYRARYMPSGATVALKVLHSELVLDPIAVERFHREARCLARLRGGNVVASYDRGETSDGAPYIAMELLGGERLDVHLRARGKVPWRRTVSILREVCAALIEVHAHGIVHRGLSPRNVMLDGERVVLVDFGTAKLCADESDEDLTVAGHAVGRLDYSAPEQLSGHACDARADLYALGTIAVEVLTGGRGPLALPADAPPELSRVITRCLELDPAARWSSATELAAELQKLVTPARRLVFAHTPAFELQPPRIVIDLGGPAALPRARRGDWGAWALAAVACVLGFAMFAAGCH